MNFPPKTYLLILSLFSWLSISAQEAAVIDSIKNSLSKAKTVNEKVMWLDQLSRTMMNVNPKEGDEYGNKLITVAEESRDRKLMFKAYLLNGQRCSYFANQKTYST